MTSVTDPVVRRVWMIFYSHFSVLRARGSLLSVGQGAHLIFEPGVCMSITTISLKEVPSIWKA